MEKKIVPVILWLLLLSQAVIASESWLDLEVWCELEPLVSSEGSEFPVPKAEAVNRLLDEARILYSYMIYGGRFTYTPSDEVRQVAETFNIEPFFEISWGDENLKVRESRVKTGRLYAIIRYHLEDFQALRIAAWQSNLYPAVTGRGSGDIFQGYKQKITAYENSIKEGVRAYLRQQIYNKPNLIGGEFILQSTPYVIIKAGEYIATTRIKLNVKKISAYNNF